MGKLGRDVRRRRLRRHLSQSFDEPMISLISAVVAVQSGNANALKAVSDLPLEAVGTELGSKFHIPLWSLETLVNELLATPKRQGFEIGRYRFLDPTRFNTLRTLHLLLSDLENAEDEIFLENHDVFYEVSRIAQRQFPWQRGILNAPRLYRSMLLYGKGSANDFFQSSSGISVSDLVKVGMTFQGALLGNDYVDRARDLSVIGISPGMREAALAKFAVPHAQARECAAKIRQPWRHTAYNRSILRDFPIIAFGDCGERLRAPIPDLIMLRCTSGLYHDVVKGGPGIWSDIGRRFEVYVSAYLQAMMAPYSVAQEIEYGPKKTRYRTPDVLVSGKDGLVAVVECKATHMRFDARYADDPVTAASRGFDELAKGIFQIWRFFAHQRRGLTGDLRVTADCQAAIITADSWLELAHHQSAQVFAKANILADAEGDIEAADRREVPFCQIDDVEFVLQHGTADSFLAACRAISSGEKKRFTLSVAHNAERDIDRPYPFRDRIREVLPWIDDDDE